MQIRAPSPLPRERITGPGGGASASGRRPLAVTAFDSSIKKLDRAVRPPEGSGSRYRNSSDGEADVHDVALFDLVVLALDAELALAFRRVPRAAVDQVVVGDDLGPDEAPLQV